MAIETTCGGCGKLLSVADEHAGRRARCPACGQVYTIPSMGSTNAPNENFGSATPSPVSNAPTATGPTGTGPAVDDATLPMGPPSIPSNPALPPAGDLTGANPNAGLPPQPAVNMNQFWMRSTDGVEYGPVDRETLDRWFREGRVGPGYMIRQSETGMWQSAEMAKPMSPAQAGMYTAAYTPGGAAMSGGSASNPYAAAGMPGGDAFRQMYPKPDQSGLVLAFGILSWFICPIFGIIAWIMGRNGLKDIAAGLMDPANKGLMQAGYYLGMVCIILYSLCFGGYIVFVALAIGFGGMR